MKHIKTLLLALLLTTATGIQAQVQTLVNRLWVDTTGHPVQNSYFQTARREGSYVYIAGSSYHQGQSANVLITKYSTTGTKIWQKEYNTSSDNADLVTDMYVKGNYYYATGTMWDSANARSNIFVLKGSIATGDTTWLRIYTGSYAGYHAGASILPDNNGNVYVGGAEQESSSNFRMLAIKYDSTGTQQWASTYDSAGYYDAIVTMGIDAAKNYLTITGFSGSGFASWDFVTTAFNLTTGVRHHVVNRSSNGNGAFSQPVGIGKDYSDNTYIAGTSAINAYNTDIKIVKYDTLFNEVWVRRWGKSDSLKDETTAFAQDVNTNLLLTGYTTGSGGAKSMLVLKYSTGGTLLWSRTVSAPNPANNCIGKDIVADDSSNVYVTGSVHNGVDNDIITICYDKNGTLKWQQIYDSQHGVNDDGYDIAVDSIMGVYVSGLTLAAGPQYVLVSYRQFTQDSSVHRDTLYNPMYFEKRLIVRFDTSALKRYVIDELGTQFGSPSSFIKQYVIDTINDKLHNFFKGATVSRVYKMLPSTVSTSITRLGDTIPIPDLWTTLEIQYEVNTYSIKRIIDSLNTIFPIVRWTEPNYLLQPSTPNDPLLSNQISLLDPLSQGGDINVSQVWNTYNVYGANFVKVGVLDGGIDGRIDDFGGNGSTHNPNKIDGHDFTINGNNYMDAAPHGNLVSSVIGAISNNNTKIAGIAGGNSINSSDIGVKLYGMKIYALPSSTFTSAATISDAIVSSSLGNIVEGYGWGVDILNIASNSSWTPFQGNISVLNPQLLGINEALHFANRCQVTTVISSGNSGAGVPMSMVRPPANVEDGWALAVGGSNLTGQYNTSSHYGEQLDLVAPASANDYAIYANNYSTSFGGTSSASAHVSGAVALLMSYLNQPVANEDNLAPEDVEFILQESAHDINDLPALPNYDVHTGYGLLDCGASFDKISKPDHKIMHLSYQKNMYDFHTQGHTITTPATGVDVYLTKDYGNFAGGILYKADVREVESTFNYSNMLSVNDIVQYGWARSSSSSLFGPVYSYNGNNFIDPYEKLTVTVLADQSDISFKSYAYKMYDAQTNAFLGWIPFQPDLPGGLNSQLEEAFSLLVYSPFITSDNSVSDQNNLISVFPNPSTLSNIVHLNIQNEAKVHVSMCNTQGEIVSHVIDQVLSAGSHKFEVDLTSIANGAYYYTILIGDKSMHHIKFIKI